MHVGVFLVDKALELTSVGLPHARGGVFTGANARDIDFASSPCTWGCFLYESFRV